MDTDHLDAAARYRLERMVERVASSPHNLVSRSDRQHVWQRHVVDSLAVEPFIPPGARRLLDIGTGGGFPGLVLAIARPDLEVHLMDATRKKTRFLVELITELDVVAQVHTGRAEELSDGCLAGSFDVVTARAVAPLVRLAPLAAAYVSPSGRILAIKGSRWAEEVVQAERTLVDIGLEIVATPADHRMNGQPAVDAGPKLVILAPVGRSES